MNDGFFAIFYQKFRQRFPETSENTFSSLYGAVEPKILGKLFSIIHNELTNLMNSLNTQLPTGENTGYFWADPSRDLIFIIDFIERLTDAVKNTEYTFDIDGYYSTVLEKCDDFLHQTRGSTIPEGMEKIHLYYSKPIFIQGELVSIESIGSVINSKLVSIGSGSYGTVYKFYDDFYQTSFALKRAAKTLNEKELERFANEYKRLSESDSPFIVKVYRYDDKNNQYIMELMDFSLDGYFRSMNNNIHFNVRKKIGIQIIRAVKYINLKGLFHRDLCPNNILIKCYDDGTVISKLSDFGLVKDNASTLTSIDSDIKGSYHDPDLDIVGFHNYSLKHEIFALTKTLRYVLTGITSLTREINENVRQFAERGMCQDQSKRYQSIEEVEEAFKLLKDV